jgi:hypothetical protein
MSEPSDIRLLSSEFKAVKQQKQNYILVRIYYLPNAENNIGYKAIPDPKPICSPIKEITIYKSKWLE